MAFGVFLFLIARIYQTLRGEDGIPSDEVFHAAMAMAHGQWLEWRHTGDLTLTSDTLNEILTHKTSQLFASATRIGALQAQAEPQVVRGLSDYGLAIGTAFQITDDILDVCGATQRLGKQVGTDLCAHKVTLPIVLLLKQLTGSDRERMMQMVDPTHQVSQDDLIWVRNQVTLHGIDRQCKEEANRHLRKAIVALEVLPESEAKHILIALALHMADRWS